jgi:hypothetical protein
MSRIKVEKKRIDENVISGRESCGMYRGRREHRCVKTL